MEPMLRDLLQRAKDASQNAYAPYSHYKVGAALRTKSGQIYTGCNVENSSFSMTICAERNAAFQAIAAGEREFTEIAIYVDAPILFPPCGACRQVLSEFSHDMKVVFGSEKEVKTAMLSELLPESFSLRNE